MLEGLYTINEEQENAESNECIYKIHLNADHVIFKGHFPEQAVLPGVCQLGIINQLLEKKYQLNLELIQASNIKFLQMIDPHVMNTITIKNKLIERTRETIKISSVIESKGKICLKFKGVFNSTIS